MNLLLHICCGICLGGPLQELRRHGIQTQGYFYNPNIFPFAEFKRRVEALRTVAQANNMPLYYEERYGLEDFLREAMPNDARRCFRCYLMRLRATARKARAIGCDAFSTTLLVSRHQKHDWIREAGQQAAAENGIAFHYDDWRPLNTRSYEIAKSLGIYRQRYCGCAFSQSEVTRQHVGKVDK